MISSSIMLTLLAVLI